MRVIWDPYKYCKSRILMTLLTLESRALIKLSWLIIWVSQALISPETINQDRVNSKGLQKVKECRGAAG
jgi:hypothetical protein